MTARTLACFVAVCSLAFVASACGDKCAGVSCSSGQSCDPATGACLGSPGGGAGGGSGGGGGDAGGSGGGAGGDVDGGMDGGQDAGPPPSGETCETAIPLVSGVMVEATTAGMTNDYNQDQIGGCADSTEGTGDRVYKISVPPGQLVIGYLLADTNFNTILNLITAPTSNCGTTVNGTTTGTTCVSTSSYGFAGEPEYVSWLNTGSTAVDVFFVIDGLEAGDEGLFDLTVTVGPPAQGDTCAAPKPLNASLPLETWTNAGPDYPKGGRFCALGYFTDRVYALDIPAQSKVTVTGTPTAGDLGLAILEGPTASCLNPVAPVGCVMSADQGFAGEAETVTLENGSNAVRTVYLVASLYSVPESTETFSLVVTFANITASPAGDRCATATPVSPGLVVNQTLRGFYDDHCAPRTMCGTARESTGVDRVYSLDVPAGSTLTAKADQTPDGGTWDIVLYMVPGGGACPHFFSSCLAGANDRFSIGETVAYTNDGGAAQPVFIVVDSADEDHGTFNLETTLSP